VFERAVSIRLRGDVPVAGYLSGGVDSTSVMSAARRTLGRALPSFTIRIASAGLDETDRALLAARRLGAAPTIVECDATTIRRLYPKLIVAAEAPVVDTSCAALYRQAQIVRQHGFKVVLTGEGADEAFAGYPWLKAGKALGLLDFGAMRTSNLLRHLGAVVNGRGAQWPRMLRFQEQVGGPNGLLDFYYLICLTRRMFYSPGMLEQLGEFSAFDDLKLDAGRIARFHPLNRALYLGYKTMLPGLLMSQKGDRPAMHNSVETRHPFLDETVIEFCARLPPSLKLRRLRGDKHLLRRYARQMLPPAIADRPKSMFRAPFADTFFTSRPEYVDALLSESSLRATGYFDPARVRHFRTVYKSIRLNPLKRLLVDMGLTGVIATQLWHHTFLGGGLCELPTWGFAPSASDGCSFAPRAAQVGP
jgi:asparagine synthase (glutamine-hydrolysing)